MYSALALLGVLQTPPVDKPPCAVVWRDGRKLEVESFEVKDGDVVIIDKDGDRLVEHADKVDLDASRAACPETAGKDAPKPTPTPTPMSEDERLLAASKAALQSPHAGAVGFSVAGENGASAEPSPDASPTPSSVDSGDAATWRRRNEETRRKLSDLEAQIAPLRKDLAGAETNLHIAGELSNEAAFIRGQIQKIKAQLDPLERALKTAQDERRKFEDDARAAKVPAAWVR